MFVASVSYEEYIEKAVKFHGCLSPGILMGGFMVDYALTLLPEGILYDVISESAKCLPDAVQLLTPCSIGNGWLKILKIGRFAMTFFNKHTGEGIRVWLDTEKLNQWPAIKEWFLKLAPKDQQNTELIMQQIKDAGTSVFSSKPVFIDLSAFKKTRGKPVSICPICKEGFPASHGKVCRVCAQSLTYYADNNPNLQIKSMKISA